MTIGPGNPPLVRSDTAASPLWTRLWLIAGVALLLRLAWAGLVPIAPVSDSYMYDGFAKSIAFGKGYAYPGSDFTVYWPVGASAVYAAIYKVFGAGGWSTAIIQAVLGAVVVVLTIQLARRYSGPRQAALAGWLVAFWPLMIQFTTILASELIFVALVLAALNVWASERMQPLARACLWGALIAGATYVRPTAWPMLLIFPLCAWIVDRQGRNAILTLGLSVLTAALLFAPWVYRNYQLFDRFVLVAANSGPNLWMGNNPESSGGYMPLPERAFANEIDRDRFYGGEAVAYIKSHPLDYLRLAAKRAVMTYDRETIGVVWNEGGITHRFGSAALQPLKLLSTLYWWPMLALGAWGVWRNRKLRRLRQVWPVLVPLGYFAAVPILTVGQDRYHVPIDPLLAIFASWALLGSTGWPKGESGVASDG